MTNADFETLFNEAIRLRDAGQHDEAVKVLTSLAETGENLAAVYGVMGGIMLFQLDNPAGAVPCFKKACELSPRSEKASLGLFHALWESGERDAAFSEMRRYVSQRPSEEYARLVRELNQELDAGGSHRPE